MGRLTTHVLDIARGRPGAGITVELYAFGEERRFVTTTTTDEDVRCPRPLLEGSAMVAGVYELVFHAGEYFRGLDPILPLAARRRRDDAGEVLVVGRPAKRPEGDPLELCDRRHWTHSPSRLA